MKVTIVGAGLGGLTLARVLYRNGVEVEIYEAAEAAGPRGGTLNLRAESGYAALRTAGVLGHLPAILLDGDGATRVVDTGNAVRSVDDAGPVVDRDDLRDLLLASLPDDTVHWGQRVVETRAGGEIVLGHGPARRTEALVGADGAWSAVRPLVSDAVPAYSGFSYVEVRGDRPEPAGLIVTVDDEPMLVARPGPAGLHGYARVEAPAKGLARRTVLRHVAGWHPDLRALFTGDLTTHPIHVLPDRHVWPRVPGVTLIGDAAHLASPFTADGANLAMLDGAELALAIADHPDDLERALAAYEQKLFARGTATRRRYAEAV